MAPVTPVSEYLKHLVNRMTRTALALGSALELVDGAWKVSQMAHEAMLLQPPAEGLLQRGPGRRDLTFAGLPVLVDAWDVDTWQFRLVITGATT